MPRRWKYVWVAGLFVTLAIMALLLLTQRRTGQALPVPNGYDDFVLAARNVVGDSRPVHDLSDDELRALVQENHAALEFVRRGLQRQCQVATEYTPSYLTNHMPILAEFKAVSRVFLAEGKLREHEGRAGDAARSYVDGIRFAQELTRGGLVIDRMVGLACESSFPQRLLGVNRDLDIKTCQDLLPILEKADADRESLAATWDEEARWSRSFGIRQRLGGWIIQIVQAKAWQAHRARTQQQLEQVQLGERRAFLQMAARIFELENGKAPGRAGDLVPKYLRAVPKHPATGAELSLEH